MEPVRCELDNFALVGALNRIGYDGRIDILGWGYGGDVYRELQRCLTSMREIDRRLEKHPDCGEITLRR